MASGNTDSLTENIKEQFLQCKICLDQLKEPKSLPCLHTFCKTCLDNHLDYHIESLQFHCPVCRGVIFIPRDGVDGFPDSFFVSNLTDIVQQSEDADDRIEGEERRGDRRVQSDGEESLGGWCGICRFTDTHETSSVLCVECKIELCVQHSQEHSENQLTSAHTQLKVTNRDHLENTRKNYCRVHKSELVKYYCQTCNSPICMPCTFLDHKGHNTKELREVVYTFNTNLKKLVQESEDNLIQLNSSNAYLTEIVNYMLLRKNDAKQDIKRCVMEIIDHVKDQELSLLSEVDKAYNITPVMQDRQEIQVILDDLESAHSFAETLLSEDTSPISQVVNYTDATHTLQHTLQRTIPDVSQYEETLQNYSVFYPGNIDISLGSLLRRNNQSSITVDTLRHILPSTKALYSTTIRQGEDEQVVAITQSNDNIIVLLETPNQNTNKVKVYKSTGTLYSDFGTEDELPGPTDVAVTVDKCIAICDCQLYCVKVFTIEGVIKGYFGDSALFSVPLSITVDHLGNYLVYDEGHKSLIFFKSTGEFSKQITTPEARKVHDIQCNNNKLYMYDQSNQAISVYNYNKTNINFITRISAKGSTEHEGTTVRPIQEVNEEEESREDQLVSFVDCAGIATDRYGTLYIADTKTGRVHCLNSRGELSSIRFTGKAMYRPSSLAVTHSGIIAVLQQEGNPLVTKEQEDTIPNVINLYRIVQVDS